MIFLIRSMLFAVLFTAAALCEAQEPVNLEGQTAEVNALTPPDQATSNENGENDRAGQTDYPRALPITVSPDRSLLALVTKEGQLQVLNLKRHQIKFKAENGKVTSLAFSPDGKRLAGCVAAGEVCVWDLESEKVLTMEIKTTVVPHHALVFIDNSTLATTNGRFQVIIWNLSSDDTFTLSDERIYLCSLAVSPDGRFLAVGRGAFPIAFLPRGSGHAVTRPGIIRIWNLKEKKVVQELKGHRHYGVQSLAYSPDGKTLASCGDSLVLWDTETFEKKQEIEDDVRFFWTVDFSPDGETIATTTMLDPFIKLWGVNGELIHTLHADDKKGFWSAYFLSHSPELISAARDGSIRKWMIPVKAAN